MVCYNIEYSYFDENTFNCLDSNNIFRHLGSKKRPQKTTQKVTKAPRKPAKVIPSLPDYDGDSDGIPDYKRTKGVGSSSGITFIRD